MKVHQNNIVTWIVLLVFFLLLTGSINTSKLSIDGILYSDNNFAHHTPEVVQGINSDVEKIGYEQVQLIKKYSDGFGVDFKLIMAIIKHESQFDQNAISARGAIGLMQLMPLTSNEISILLNNHSTDSLEENIRNGVYYFSKLLDLFSDLDTHNRICLALAAYNAGPSRIYDAQDLAAYMGENPADWSVIQRALPLLSKRFYSLHRSVWSDGRPPNGYFGSWRQTIFYIEKVIKSYQEYQIEIG
ncbi:MAG: transglycosylase SLT domain-containing protein [Bacteroidota bacterium]|nr:transglycosylase SLT domain-containing protein [Bacteroidota bacterium]